MLLFLGLHVLLKYILNTFTFYIDLNSEDIKKIFSETTRSRLFIVIVSPAKHGQYIGIMTLSASSVLHTFGF